MGVFLARSEDGRTFRATGEALMLGAGSPELIRLPGGDLLAMVEREEAPATAAPPGSAPEPNTGESRTEDGRPATSSPACRLCVSRSADGGRTWTAIRPIRLQGRRDAAPTGGGALVSIYDKTVILYYMIRSAPRPPVDREPAAATGAVLRAVTRNGLDYELDGDFRLEVRLAPQSRLVAAPAAGRIHLFIVSPPARPGGRDAEAAHFLSTDGRRFEPAPDAPRPAFRELLDLEATHDGLRAFVPSPAGLRSLISRDALRWRAEAGLRMAGAVPAAAVVELDDRTHLMLFSALVDEPARRLPQLAAVKDAGPAGDTAPAGKVDASSNAAGAASGAAENGATTVQPQARQAGDDAADTWPPFGPMASAAEASGALADTVGGSSGLTPETDEDADPFAPLPDFERPVDYWQWFQEQHPTDVPDNAAGDYQALMQLWPALLDEQGGINDMFNSDYSGPRGPWDPAAHPEWEATHQRVSAFLDQFAQATWHEYLAEPLALATPRADGGPLLMELTLPGLAPNRAWVKACLADALRMEDGRVPPQRMLDRLGAVYRNATLVRQGPTLIHTLVGIAEQRLADEVALDALGQGVFSTPDDLAAAYQTLSSFSLPAGDPIHWLRFEHAAAMQLAQYLVTPAGPDGVPQVNQARVEEIAGLVGGEPTAPDGRPYELSVEMIQANVELLDAFYREEAELLRTGYPQVRGGGLEATERRYAEAAPLAQPVIPALGRAHQITTRGEAMRRATQLVYALHLYKSRTGTWPASLADLPESFGQTIRTDPFTGGYFGYQLTESGPKVYSLGEDGVDGGGTHSRRWGDDRKTPDESDDYVFWPPQK